MARSQLALLLLLLVSCCVPEAASTAEAASKLASKSESSKYKYWDRSAGKKKDTKLSDFNQDEDPRLKQDGLVGGDPMTPKFRWSQDPRQVSIVIRVKNLQNIILDHDSHWLNFTAIGDTQRTVGARHDTADGREQAAKQGIYTLRLPLARAVDSNRTTRKKSEGYTVFVLRKENINSEWTHLLKEPARTNYKHHMTVDFKKSLADDDDSDEDTFKVEKVTSSNIDDVIATPGPIILQFNPSWVPAAMARHWIQGFGGAAEALEGRATFGRINALTEPKLLERFDVSGLSQRDGNNSLPVYKIFNDGGWLLPEDFDGYTDPKRLVDLIVRMEDVCDVQPCPSVHRFAQESELNIVIGRREYSAIAIGMKESDALAGPLSNASRSLQAIGSPPVGVGWMAGGPAFNALQSLLGSMAKLDLKTVDYPAMILIRVPGAPEDSPAGAAPPIMIVSAAVARPLNGKKFKKAELKAIIAGWGMKNKGLQDEWTADTVRLALRCNVPTVLLQLPAGVGRDAEEGSPEAAALGAVYALGGDNDLPAVQMLLRSGTKQDAYGSMQTLAKDYSLPVVEGRPQLAVIHKGKAFVMPASKADGPEAAAELKKLLGDVIAGKAKAAARSEAKPSKMHGPGSGRVDKVVSKTAVEFVNQSSGPEPVDTVLVVYDSTSEASRNREKSAGKVAEKVAHVATLAFGAIDTSKNDLPAELEKRLGGDPKKYDGVWVFPAQEDGKPAGLPKRCKRKAGTKEVAAWLKKSAAVGFPAKPAALPAGPYTDSCSGCRVMSNREASVLKCNSCDGSAPTAKSECTLDGACASYANLAGVLGCGDGTEDGNEVVELEDPETEREL